MKIEIEMEGQGLRVTWDGETCHGYRIPQRLDEQTIRNSFADFLGENYVNWYTGDVPVVRSTGDAYEQGIEHGWKIAGNWDRHGITVKLGDNGYTVYDEEVGRSVIPANPSFKVVREALENYMIKPVPSQEGAGGLQYATDLSLLLVERSLNLNHEAEGYRFTDRNGANVSFSPDLLIAIQNAIVRTDP